MAVETKKLIDRLEDTMQLDVDAVEAYGEAIEHITDPEIRGRLEEFKADHQRHIGDLENAIRELGGQPRGNRRPDLKGRLLEGFTALRSSTGQKGALKAMRSNETLTNKTYKDTLAMGYPAHIEAMIQRNFDDEKRHLAYIEQCLAEPSAAHR